MLPTRRTMMFGGLAAALPFCGATRLVAADAAIELDWSDLVPAEGGIDLDRLRALGGVIEHGQLSTPFDQDTSGQVTDAYNGKVVRIPGYLVPIEYRGSGISAALLVPYVGACIHVPPPPPNQLIFVTTADPYESSGMFEPVFVTGMFGTAATTTQLAEIGYTLSADRIEPYG